MSSLRSHLVHAARRRAGLVLLVMVVGASLGGVLAGCGGSGANGTSPAGEPAAVALAEVPMGDMHMPTSDEVSATWKARPDYVKTLSADWQEAYAFALARPDVLQWLPCYCGCAGMEHRSNLDCFFQRREVKGNYTYEEHASFCEICVKTANMASDMLREGKTMVQIRDAVDAKYGNGAAPGTDTPMPPASS